MRWLVGLPLIVSIAACTAVASEPAGQRFPVFFTPMSASLGQGADSVVNTAATFANRYQDKPITLVASLKSLAFRLWDERHRKLVGFRAA